MLIIKIIAVKSSLLILIFSVFISFSVNAQNDTITLKSGDILAGEIKLISEGVLAIETAYSDTDFKIEFNKVNKLVIQRKCLIILTKARRRFGFIKSNAKQKITITLDNNLQEEYAISEIISLQEVRENFIQRFTGAIDLSYNFAKANKTNQFSVTGKLNYNSELWRFEANISSLKTNQENAELTRRTEANIELVRLLRKKLYFIIEIPFLSNTEQAIDSRISPSFGVGKFVISTNKLYLGLSSGFTLNIENYTDATLDKSSSEVFITSTFNIYDLKDFDFKTDIKFYPSISERGRIRTDYNLSLKYNLPLDFYIKLGFSLNYDNKPAFSGSEVDYIFTSGFGWSFN
ncbi:DUF481 domain-containing protein [Lacinutrix jangbogonensis]|uniref:DUF481 domain-containing protein n=1 Tax=Lacinutrix jangbogonensis TaxID=1469557 RepID=UPI00138DFA3D|nr:DUF481 domain-containing protein [Lacinutrix jangbogonensis]